MSQLEQPFYYTRRMRKIPTSQTPIQPLREDRSFLRYAEKPPLKPTPVLEGVDEEGKPYSIFIKEYPISEVLPRIPIKEINFKSLQIWLDHLGPAIYNPLKVVQTPNGVFHVSTDGNHRSRCLWEIGEPAIRFIVRKMNTTSMNGGVKKADLVKWMLEYSRLNIHSTKTPYMFGSPRKKWKRIYRRYYPILFHPHKVLQNYFNEPRNDGKYFKDTLLDTWSFREIYSQWKETNYRMDIIDAILKDTDVADKTVLDIGAYYGWASFMLLEEGAKTAIALEQRRHRVRVINRIAKTRSYPVTPICDTIQNYEPNLEPVDLILMLNVFHHILHEGKEGWDILRSLMTKCDKMYLMMGAKPGWGILDEWDNNIVEALTAKLPGATITPLLKTSYRSRVLYVIQND